MKDNYEIHKQEIRKALSEIWDYMKLNQHLEKCDLIIGCGCSNLDIPIKCAELLNSGYADKILFAGGLGKITKNTFDKSEAEIYKDIAIQNGISDKDIIIETASTNTGDNFRFAEKLLNEQNIKHDKILIVHGPFDERRTLSAAKSILNDKDFIITSPDIEFDRFFECLDNQPYEDILNDISVIVGDIQRIIIYPQFGWQIANDVPETIIQNYFYLKSLGFSKYILSIQDIKEIINKHGLLENQEENYFN